MGSATVAGSRTRRGRSFLGNVNVRMPTDAEQRSLEVEGTEPVSEIWHVAYTGGDGPVEVCVPVMPGRLWTLRCSGGDDEQPTSTAGSS